MTSQEAYKRFLLKLNKNDTNTRTNISKGEFVLIFNEQKRMWLDDVLKQPYSIDIEKTLSDLYVNDVKLTLLKNSEEYNIYKLPENYEELTSSYTVAKNGDCIRKLYNFPKNPKNRNNILRNTNEKPSFDFEQTFIEKTKDGLIVYKDNFSIEKQIISYYKNPIDIDIEGYIKIDGSASQTINPDIGDGSVDDIINRCVLEVSINYENAEQAQMSAQRIK